MREVLANAVSPLATPMSLEPWQAILVFLAFFITILTVSVIKKIYYSVKYKKRYYILPRVGVKGITNIAMVIAISIAVIILLTVITADLLNVVFRAWPGTRVTLEGILIKIGGLLFGPFIGMFIGIMTDLLTVALTAGVFHYGYLIAAMAYGLIGGLIRVVFVFAKKKNLNFAIYSTILFAIIAAALGFFIGEGIHLLNPNSLRIFEISFLGLTIKIQDWQIALLVSGFIVSAIVVIWISYFINKSKKQIKFTSQKYEKHFHVGEKQFSLKLFKTKCTYELKKTNKNWFSTFAPVLAAIILSSSIVDVVMLPAFDANISTLGFEFWLSIRSFLFVPMVFLNVAIIYPIFKIVVPMMKYDYTTEITESKKLPIYYE